MEELTVSRENTSTMAKTVGTTKIYLRYPSPTTAFPVEAVPEAVRAKSQKALIADPYMVVAGLKSHAPLMPRKLLCGKKEHQILTGSALKITGRSRSSTKVYFVIFPGKTPRIDLMLRTRGLPRKRTGYVRSFTGDAMYLIFK